MVAAIWAGGALPPAPFWKGQAAYEEILGRAPRIPAPSFVAYLIGEFASASVLARLKIAPAGRWLWVRTLGSTIVGEGLDSLVFVALAFAGTVASGVLVEIFFNQWLVKVVSEGASPPPTCSAVGQVHGRVPPVPYHGTTRFNSFGVAITRSATRVNVRCCDVSAVAL